ncbi:hypothetical protein GGS24DRAFT_515269 [Hypoxylon argillaceum]|nr:hypothetical protein GGS24DRAFT_515269 [Hypoxylon argillaceum]KAI1156868.1 hypothetical protein F4825DRAFT_471306 [Nemania diffusa]
MSSRSHNYTRSRSRTDAFLDALEGGHMRTAMTALTPSRSTDGHRHHHSHHHHHSSDYHQEDLPRRNRYDDYYPQDSSSRHHYRSSDSRTPRHRSVQSDRYYDGRHHDHHGHRRASSSHGGPDLKHAAGAAVAAGVVEAWRSRHDANRAARVATAAVGAAATDSALLGGGVHDRKEKRHVVESALAGLVENRVINGPRR